MSSSTTLGRRVLASTDSPNRVIFWQKQEYVVRITGSKKVRVTIMHHPHHPHHLPSSLLSMTSLTHARAPGDRVDRRRRPRRGREDHPRRRPVARQGPPDALGRALLPPAQRQGRPVGPVARERPQGRPARGPRLSTHDAWRARAQHMPACVSCGAFSGTRGPLFYLSGWCRFHCFSFGCCCL